ncbi:MAG: flagellar basal-body rod protein FlgF [Alphaproteobacteria bacterium]
MDNSVYITLSRQLALFRDMDATANNIANANTTGYTSEHVNFQSYLQQDVNQGTPNKMAFAYDIHSYRNTENGPLQLTNNPLDVAINGAGYFSVQTPLGTRYTRGGSFQLSTDGTLVNAQGQAVLNSGGQPITLPEDTLEIEIGSLGNIKVNGEDFDQIGVVTFANEQLLEPAGNNLFKSDAPGTQIEESSGIRVVAGALEGSNVKPVLEMTHMMEVSRAVGNTAKFIEVVYDLQRKASNTWAKQA